MSMVGSRKLRITSSSIAAPVFVIQDGTAADATATVKYDNGFRDGMRDSTTEPYTDAEYVVLGNLTQDYTNGRSLTFTIRGRKAWLNGPANKVFVQPNDKVEFFCARPDTGNNSAYPSWHTDRAAAGQRRVFYGFVERVEPRPGESEVIVTCRDGLWKAQDIAIQRDTLNGVTIPKIAFNLQRDHPDYVYSVKVTDYLTSPATIGTGVSNVLASPTYIGATVKEILTYLSAQYNSTLISRQVLDPAAGVAVFNTSDLSVLTAVPEEIILENVTFVDAVREVLRYAPHVRMIADPVTTQWRILPVDPALDDTVRTVTNAAIVGNYANLTLSSTSGLVANNYVRIYKSTYRQQSFLTQLTGVVGSVISFDLTLLPFAQATWSTLFSVGDLVVKLDVSALPSKQVNLDDCMNVSVQESLEGSFSAVKIYSTSQETKTQTWTMTPEAWASSPLNKNWIPTYEQYWKEKDADKEEDRGKDGRGMQVYKVTRENWSNPQGGSSSADTLYIPYAESAYGSDQVSGEWDLTTLWVWTRSRTISCNSTVTSATPTVITATAHGLLTGSRIYISGATSGLNGTWDITKISADTFSIPTSGSGQSLSGATVLTLDDVKDEGFQFTILGNTTVADIGDGRAGFKLFLKDRGDGAFSAVVPTFRAAQSPLGNPVPPGTGWSSVAAPYDRVVISHSSRFGTTLAFNKRWEVGRKFVINSTVVKQTMGQHSSTCSPFKILADEGMGLARRTMALSPYSGFPIQNRVSAGTAMGTSYSVIQSGYPGANGQPIGQLASNYGPTIPALNSSTYVDGSYSQAIGSVLTPQNVVMAPRPIGSFSAAGGVGYQLPRSITVEVEYTQTIMRTARYPAANYSGEAFMLYGLQRELAIATDKWTSDVQQTLYDALAQNIHYAVSHANQQGSFTMPGVKEWGEWIDLCSRFWMYSTRYQPTLAIGGYASTITGFWGLLTSTTWDFASDTVNLNFDTKSALEDIAVMLYQRIGQHLASQVDDDAAKVKKMQEELKCSLSQRDDRPTWIPSSRVQTPSGNPATKELVKIPEKNIQLRTPETGFGIPDGGGPGSLLLTHGNSGTSTVLIDTRGDPWQVNERGSIIAGTVAGSTFTPSSTPPTTTTSIYGLPERLNDEGRAHAAFMGLTAIREEHPPISGSIASGSTTSVISIAEPLLQNRSATSNQRLLILDFEDRVSRPIYTVSSITGNDTVNLTSAMSEDAPAEGVRFVLLPPQVPVPSRVDFGPTASAFEDASGNYYVFDDGVLYPATLSGNVLELNPGPVTLTANVGITPDGSSLTIVQRPQNEWDFRDATVSNIGGVADEGDILVYNAGGELVRLPVGTDGYVLTANSAAANGVAWAAGGGGGGGAPTNAQYVTLATDATLTNERVLTAGTGISISDAGAGSTVTIATTVDPAPKTAQYVTLALDDTLTNERVLVAGANISITDAGAGGNVTIAATDGTSTLTTKGDLLSRTTSALARVGVGANGYVLTADSSTSTGLAWAPVGSEVAAAADIMRRINIGL